MLSGKYDDLFNLVIFASWILYGMTAAAVLVLRKKRPIWPVRIAPWDIRSCRFCLFWLRSCWFAATAVQRPRESAIGICLIVLGLPFYFYWKRRRDPLNLRVLVLLKLKYH